MDPHVSFTGLLAVALAIAPTQIGLELGLLDPATAAALISAGLIAVVLFPAIALVQLRRASSAEPELTDLAAGPREVRA